MKSMHALAVATAAVIILLGAGSANALPWYINATGSWSQGNNGATPLASSNDSFCYLTRITGRFYGDGERVQVFADDTQTWYVGGQSQQIDVGASANCLRYATFIPEPGGVNNWTGSFWANTGQVGGPTCTIICIPPLPGFAQINAWQGDAALMISGITGGWDGAGEVVEAEQAGNGWAYNTLTAWAGSYNGVGGFAQSLFVGVPQSGFNPAFFGPGGGPTNANEAGVYSASTSAGNPPAMTVMAPTSDAFCFFTQISGAFHGRGESVSIQTAIIWGVEYWTLNVTSGQNNGTSAQARCYGLNQSVSQ
jgi:hypothetical protein